MLILIFGIKNSQWVKMIFYKDGSEIEYFLKDFDTNE